MSFISPEEIAKKARRLYPKFLRVWVRGEDAQLFPYRIRADLKPDPMNPKATIDGSERLSEKSKARRGWGYTLHRESKGSLTFGKNRFPSRIVIDTRDDLLRLAGKMQEFAATERVLERVRDEFPQLEDWLVASVQSLHKYAEPLEGLIGVAKYFLANPWPDCYARQLPVSVDTKFVEDNKSVLRQWLDVLPGVAVDVNETKFARRFGLRDGQPHRGVRLLDEGLAEELGLEFEELSLPLQLIAKLPVRHATAVIVENRTNLFTLPEMRRGIALEGVGKAVTRLERIGWLATNRLLYWGDLDVDGFLILASLRNLFPEVKSVMMDCETLERHQELIGGGNGSTPAAPTNLTLGEQAAFQACREGNRRLEQEKIPQDYVEEMVAEW